MEMTIIGIDPHKRSHTAVVLDNSEHIAAEIRVTAGSRQVDRLLAWAPAGPRVWAVENANGLGRLVSRQLAARGEQVVDVPARWRHGLASSRATQARRPMRSTPGRWRSPRGITAACGR